MFHDGIIMTHESDIIYSNKQTSEILEINVPELKEERPSAGEETNSSFKQLLIETLSNLIPEEIKEQEGPNPKFERNQDEVAIISNDLWS